MKQTDKIQNLSNLAALLETPRSQNKKIVHCHGVFDLLHIGHIRYFEAARQMGDVLVVTVTADAFVDKGIHRPAFSQNLRAEAVASLNCVDFVAINEWPTAEETLYRLRPDVYVKGSEFKNSDDDITGKIAREKKVVAEIGATLAFTDDIVFSSTHLINRFLSNLPQHINNYLNLFRKRFTLEQILATLEKMRDLNVLVIGDTILDEYQYCHAMGKSSKDPALALKYESHDLFAGGVLAVANHVANFAGSVRLMSVIGANDSHEKFIRSQLHATVNAKLFAQPDAPTTIKKRFIDGYSFNKLFEVYVMDDSGLPENREKEACRWLREAIGEVDLVIAADFGHGAIGPKMRSLLMTEAPFLAVNTQANAGNRGFHTLSKYTKADYACIAEHEMRLEVRRFGGEIRQIMTQILENSGIAKLVVTRGRHGCAVLDQDGAFVQIPSFAQKVVDRVGAGDAFLSITSLAAFLGVENEILGFLGNIVGALAVEVIGNQKAIEKTDVQKYILSLMK